MYNVTDEYKELIKSPVRCTAINGAVRLRDGSVVPIKDENIAERSLSITHKLNGRGDFRPGGVYSGELRAGLKGFAAKTSDLDGAVIRLNFVLYHDSGMSANAAEAVPLGRFYVDGSEIKRSGDTVTLSASDAMMLFDIPATERSGTLYELVCGSCTAAGVTFGMTKAEFEALPNGTQSAAVNTARIQTERDLLMYVGMMTASFARISRDNSLEFVLLTASKTSGGVIIPVREILGDVRFSTDFSDDTTRVTSLFTRRSGAVLSSDLEVVVTGTEKLATMELNENPLLSGLSESEVVTVLNHELNQLYLCLNRVFDTDFNGDPALDVGDYIRLRGGSVDTSRGYATGMITSQTWRYHGQHTIKCSMPSSLIPAGTDTQAVALMSADAVVQGTGSVLRVQPKSQLEKRVDELESLAADTTAEKLISPDKASHAAVANDSGLWLYKNGAPWAYLIPLNGGFKLGNTGPAQIEMPCDRNTVAIYNTNNGLWLANPGGSQGDILLRGNNSQLRIEGGAMVGIDLDGIQVDGGNSPLDILKTSEGWKIYANNCLLEAKADGLYYNNTKIGGKV